MWNCRCKNVYHFTLGIVGTYIFLYRMKDAIRRVEDISIPTAVPDMLSIRSILSRVCEV